MNFIHRPYLPEKKVVVAVADRPREGVKVIKPYRVEKLPEGLRSHADLTFCYLGDGVAVAAKEAYEYYKKELSDLPINLIPGEAILDMHYPYDAAYNIAIVGDRVFCKRDITDKVLLNECEKRGYKIIDIKQGYAKCSVCPVDEKSAISADMSFVKKAKEEGLDVLVITNDTILLRGFGNGFFGGCAYMADKNVLVTAGSLKTHPDYEKIVTFLKSKNIAIESDCELPLYDFGSFIPIMEE